MKDNQISNKNIGSFGPKFFLQEIAVREINGRKLMDVLGYFHGPDLEVQNHFRGLLIDANPNDGNRCRIEELIFQADTDELFKKYADDFEVAANSIQWARETLALTKPKDYKLQF